MNLSEKKSFVGVDCHKNSIACYVNGRFKEFRTDCKSFKKALEWAGKDAHWCVEGAYSYGLAFSTFLLSSGCKVFEVNPLITSRLRKVDSIAGFKNDFGDAKVISMFAHQSNFQTVSLRTVKLKEKISARKLLVKQRVELINSIKSAFVKRGEVPLFKCLTTLKAIKWLSKHPDIVISSFGKVINELTNSINLLEKEIEDLMPKEAQKLTELTGISTLSAAIIYTETKGNKMTKAQFASYAGVAPVECSSGLTQKHRNNKRGNRELNCVFYQISVQQSTHDEKGSAYYEKKIAEGKTKHHARKCLSRQLVNLVWKILNEN
jgi:transposase